MLVFLDFPTALAAIAVVCYRLRADPGRAWRGAAVVSICSAGVSGPASSIRRPRREAGQLDLRGRRRARGFGEPRGTWSGLGSLARGDRIRMGSASCCSCFPRRGSQPSSGSS